MAGLLWATATGTLSAQDDDPPLPPPHLGYGISIGTHQNVQPNLPAELGMDWVKLYDLDQVEMFADEYRILYRMNVRLPDDFVRFRQDVMHIARRAASLGVDAIEVGNEPNLGLEWGRPDPEEYVQVLSTAYEVIKSVDPRIIVVSGGLAPADNLPDGSAMNDLEFAEAMFELDAQEYFDAFGYHPYGFDQPPEADPTEHPFSFRRAEVMRELMEANGVFQQMWITEFGWLRDPAEDGVDCVGQGAFQGFEWLRVPGDIQADYIVRAFDWADRNWPWAGPMFLWNLDWQLYDESHVQLCDQMRWFGLLRRDGSPTPAFDAVAEMERRESNYLPIIGAYTEDMSETVEAYCPDMVPIGEFTVINTGYPAPIRVQISPLNSPSLPVAVVTPQTAAPGDTVSVMVYTGNLRPGLHMIVINLEAEMEDRRISGSVQGWVQATFPTSQRCIEQMYRVSQDE